MIAISTPGDDNNWYSVLMTRVPDKLVKVCICLFFLSFISKSHLISIVMSGCFRRVIDRVARRFHPYQRPPPRMDDDPLDRPPFNQPPFEHKIYQSQLACARCKANERESECRHAAVKIPKYKDPRMMELARQLQPPHIHKQETLGVITANGNALLTKAEMDAIKSLPRYEFKNRCELIWVAVDPSAGSLDKSRYALTAFAINADRQYVVCCFFCCCAWSTSVSTRLYIGWTSLRWTSSYAILAALSCRMRDDMPVARTTPTSTAKS
jgi:hypothetical protein